MKGFFTSCLFIVYTCDASCTTMSTSSSPAVLSNDTNITSAGDVYDSMTSLYIHLLKKYDSRVKPRRNLSEPVTITGSFALQGILAFDTASQKLSILGYFIMKWSDEILVWDPLLHDLIEALRFPIGQVWTPNMMTLFSFAENSKIGSPNDIITIWSNGTVRWTPENTFKILCDVNTKFYPFDRQSCEFYVYVSDTTTSETDLTEIRTEISNINFRANSEWKVVSISSERIVRSILSVIRIILELKRRHEFITHTIIAPLVLLSILNVGVIIVPVESGEKGSIAVTIFLSYGIFISTISDELPHNSLNISYMLIYILLLLLFSVIAVVYTYMESYIYTRFGNQKVSSRWLRKVLNFLKLTPNSKPSPRTTSNTDKDKTNLKCTQKLDLNEYTLESDELKWIALLQKMDIVVFMFFLTLILITTPAFFVFMAYAAEN